MVCYSFINSINTLLHYIPILHNSTVKLVMDKYNVMYVYHEYLPGSELHGVRLKHIQVCHSGGHYFL